ncbi:MAG TPA: glycosyltransferase family 39 protein [Elusimicrobiales bacterium]|nr:glycosyltransferase family 39 protein [Elusimicrobiales bacterium]
MRLGALKKHGYLLVLLPALAVKAGVWLHYQPALDGRPMTYVQSAVELLERGTYRGVETFRRTPGYPLFLAAIFKFTGVNAAAVTLAQHLLGLGTAFAVMRLVFALWASPAAAAAAGLVIALHPTLVFFESTLESETLAVFLFSCSLLLSALALKPPVRRRWHAPAAGLAGAAAALCRPELAAFAAVPALLLLFEPGGRKPALAFGCAFLAPLLFWMARNSALFGCFTLSPMGAITSLQTSGPFIDQASPAHRELKLLYAEALKENGGDHNSVINTAVARLGANMPGGRALAEGYRLGLETFRAHPLRYLLATGANFRGFIGSLTYLDTARLDPPWPLKIFQWNLLWLAALGFAAAVRRARGGAVVLPAAAFLCLLAANSLVEMGMPRRSIVALPALAVCAAYLVVLLEERVRALKAGNGPR